MKIQELQERYYLHDSYFENIKINEKEKIVIMTVNFAYWMQEWYKNTQPENGILKMTFHGVTLYEQSDDSIDFDMVGILRTTVEEDTMVFALGDDINDEYFELKIRADFVDVQEYS